MIIERCRRIVVGAWAAWLVWLMHFPDDSTTVRGGAAAIDAVIALVLAAASVMCFAAPRQQIAQRQTTQRQTTQCQSTSHQSTPQSQLTLRGRLLRRCKSGWTEFFIAWVPWAIAFWMFVSAIIHSQGPEKNGSLFVSLNYAAVWLIAASVVTAGRRIGNAGVRGGFMALLIAGGVAASIQAAHGHFVMLPSLAEQFGRDPEALLESAGINAPVGSSLAMVFANRLLDGGSAGPFILANTLAGFLVMGLVIAATHAWRSKAQSHQRSWRWTEILCGGTIAVGLWVTQSRTAWIAVLVTLIAYALATRSKTSDRLKQLRGLGLIVAAAGLLVTIVIVSSRSELVAAAPASLMTRFDYWTATINMVADSPWTGVGPGHFQNVYERFRVMTASEQVADPHNFAMETLALGGVPAAIGLAVWLAAVVRVGKRTWANDAAEDLDDRTYFGAVGIGAAVGLMASWLFLIAGGRFDAFLRLDFQSSLGPIPGVIGIAVAYALFRRRETLGRRCPLIAAWAALVIHLCISGGMTVPGLGTYFWLLMPLAINRGTSDDDSIDQPASTPGRCPPTWFAVGALMLMAAGTYGWIVKPADTVRTSMSIASAAARRGNSTGALRAIETALRWGAPEAAVWYADLHHAMYLRRQGDRDRDAWIEAARGVRRVVGRSPGAIRHLGETGVHAYQQTGNLDDLRLADRWYREALLCGPSDERTFAQAAEVARGLGDRVRAENLYRRAIEISVCTANPERDLKLIHILPAIHDPAAGGVAPPIRRPAADTDAARLAR